MLARIKAAPGWLWVVLAAAALRLPFLGVERLWFDEAFSATVARPGTDFWRALIGDDHPPLWSIIEWVVERTLGRSEFALRLPAALLSIACAVLVYKIAELVIFRRAAIVAGLLAGIMPAFVYFGQDARMYPLLTFGVLLALYAAMVNKWRLLFAGGLIAVYSQNVGVLYILCLGVVVLLYQISTWQNMRSLDWIGDHERRQAFNNVLLWPALALFGVALAWSPWAVVVVHQMGTVHGQFWLPTGLSPIQFFEPLLLSTMGWRLLDPLSIPLYLVAIGFTLLGFYAARHLLRDYHGQLLIAVIIGTPVSLALLSGLWANVYVFRALLPSATALMVVWAYPLVWAKRANKLTAWAILLPAVALGLYCQFFVPTKGRMDTAAFLAVVRDNWAPGDVMYHTSATTAITMGWYSPADWPQIIRPSTGSIISITNETRAAFGLKSATFDELRAQGYKRAWIVYEDTPVNTKEEIDAWNALLARGASIVEIDYQDKFNRLYLAGLHL